MSVKVKKLPSNLDLSSISDRGRLKMNDLLNLSSITAEQLTSYLKQEMLLKDITQKILYRQIIERVSEERGIDVSPDEIQAQADKFRRAKHLEKASQAIAWLEENMITSDEWEAGIRAKLLKHKLADSLFDKEAEKVFAENRSDYELASLYHIAVPFEHLAQEIRYQIEEEEISFFYAAHLYDIDARRRCHCGYEGKLSRWDLKSDIATIIFGSTVHFPIGPIEDDDAFHLFLVEEFISPELTPTIKQDIVKKLFKDWLERELIHRSHGELI